MSVYLETISTETINAQLNVWSDSPYTLMVLVAESDRSHIPSLQQICRDRNLRLVGGMFPGLLVEGRLVSSGMLLLQLPASLDYLLSEPLEDRESEQAVVARLSGMVSDERQILLLFFDSMIPRTASLLESIYLELGDRVGYAGASAGSETFQPMPCLFDHERFIGGAVLAVLLPEMDSALLEHGYPVPSKKIFVTSSEGNCIQTIDWRPAFEVYRELAEEQYGVAINRENFYEYAVHMPFGILQANGEAIVRIPVALNDDGAIFCVGEVPDSAILVLLQGPEAALLEGVRKLAADVAARRSTNDSLLFYCAGRRMHLGADAVARELTEFSRIAGPVSGALSLGEVGVVSGQAYPAFHNATLVHCPTGSR